MAVVQSQQIAQSILSDAAAKNAASLTNATNAIEVDKVNATLALTAQQFSASEKNKIALANMDASNELIKFNAQEANDRADFNAKMSTEINVANARLLAEVSTANTAGVNAANAVNAKNATDLSASAYAQQSQTYRDLLEMSWKTGESGKDRIANLAIASITKDVANIKADSDNSAAWGKLLIEGLKNWDTVKKVIGFTG
jgi:isopenicillin N synthase-like dioxygenase